MKSISVILASFSVAMCVVLAYFLSFTTLLEDRISGTNRQILIAILLAYGIFRIFRVYKLIKKMKS